MAMMDDEVEDSSALGSGCALATLFVVLSLLWMVLLAGLLVLLLSFGVVSAEAEGGAVYSSLVSAAMLLGLVAIAALIARWRGLSVASSFAWRRCGLVLLGLGLLAGVCLEPALGWFALLLAEQFEALDATHMEVIASFLCEGPLSQRALFAAFVLVLAPVAEELIFRGFLWNILERSLPRGLIWLITSLAFALYHFDPLHVLSVLPLAVALGWLRLVSGSVWPAIAAHFGNNAVAVLWLLASGSTADVEVPVVLAGAAALVTLICLVYAGLFQSRGVDARE
jgi:membrane protease YdiL (CAAX protease family)